MDLLILAAGMGSRFGGLKQLEPMDKDGNFIIDYSVFDAIRTGFNKVVLLIKEENYELFKETVGSRIESKIKTEYVFQKNILPDGYTFPKDRIKPLGTAHAILCCQHAITDNFVMINADDFYGKNAYETIAKYMKGNENSNNFAMVGYEASKTITGTGTVKRGVCSQKDGFLTEIKESAIGYENGKLLATPLNGESSFNIPENQIVSMNMFAFTPKLFDILNKEFINFLEKNKNDMTKCEFLIPDVVEQQIKNNNIKVKVLQTNSNWLGVTYKEDKLKVMQGIADLVKSKQYPEHLWK